MPPISHGGPLVARASRLRVRAASRRQFRSPSAQYPPPGTCSRGRAELCSALNCYRVISSRSMRTPPNAQGSHSVSPPYHAPSINASQTQTLVARASRLRVLAASRRQFRYPSAQYPPPGTSSRGRAELCSALNCYRVISSRPMRTSPNAQGSYPVSPPRTADRLIRSALRSMTRDSVCRQSAMAAPS
jgi:hypothetical protein